MEDTYRITALEDKYFRVPWYVEVATGTTGTITPPTGGTIVLNQWAGDISAITSTITVSKKPTGIAAKTSAGADITVTMSITGAWALSGTPSAYPIAIIYYYDIKLFNYNQNYSLYTSAAANLHLHQHVITSTADHSSTSTPGKIQKADANGLPVDATNTDTEVSSAVTLKHTQGTDQGLDTGGAHAKTAEEIHDAVDLAHSNSLDHARQHALTSTSDHTGSATPGQVLKADASGLPIDIGVQTANQAFMGPVSGAAANPAFRSPQAKDVVIPDGVGTPTYDDVQDYLNLCQASGRLTGGVLTAHAPADGTVDISAMEGLIHTENTLGSPLIYFKKAASNLALTSGAVNFINITYSTGTLTYSATTSRPADGSYNTFVVGRCWCLGNDVEAITTGQNVYDMYGRAQDRLITKYGAMDHSSGAIISAHATPLRLTCTGSVWYAGNTKTDLSAVTPTTFQVWYKSGSATWNESTEMTLFSDIFNSAAAKTYETYQNGNSLGALGANKYGVYWIFMCPEGDLYVLLGTAIYSNVGAAQAATVPASLPPYLVNWGVLIGRVICQNAAAAFYSVESVFTTKFTLSAVVDHSSLAGLANDDHTQYAPKASPVFTTQITTPVVLAPANTLVFKPTTDATTAIQLSDKDGNAILTVDTTNDRVGIGTTGPTEILDITKSVAGQLNALIKNTDTGATSLASWKLGNSGSNIATLQMYGTGFTTAGAGFQDGTHFFSNGAGGFSIESRTDAANGEIRFYVGAGQTERMRIETNGNVGIGLTGPTAVLHLKAGTATASTAPLKLTSGTVNTTPEAGAIEFDGTNLFVTI
jgi:hypothetical protein